MKLVFVHGRSQEGREPGQLRREWILALEKGLEAIGAPQVAEDTVAFPYYGDVLFELASDTAKAESSILQDKGAAPPALGDEEQQFMQAVVFALARQHGITDRQIAREAFGDTVELGVQNWRAVIAALRLLDLVPGVTSVSVQLIARDVWYYLTRPGLRATVNAIVDSAIPIDEPCVIVGHSLGSIIAYNVLMDRPIRANVKRLITLGSPLGIEAIYKRLPTNSHPRKAPTGVAKWFNARAPLDAVALFEIPAQKYRGEPVVDNFSGVVNDSENKHGICEYLRDSIVAGAISNGLD